MATDLMAGLLGPSPQEIYAAQQQALDQQAQKMASMDGFGLANYLAAKAGQGAGQLASGMLGLENPAIRQAKMREQALADLDTSDPEAILKRAQQVQDPRLKLGLGMMARQVKQEQEKIKREEFKMNEEFQWRKDQAKEQAAQRAEQAKAVLEQRAEAARLRSEDARLGIEQRAQAAKEANSLRVMLAQLSASTKASANSLGKPPPGYRWTAAGDLETIPGGPKDMTAKNKAMADTLEVKSKLITDKIDEALSGTGFFTTGLTGEVLGKIPGTAAYDLEAALDTVKANIGFNELQAMRQASPTGGALGQVAVRELDMLQAVLGSLKKGQSEDKLRQNLQAVKTHYSNWKKAVDQAAKQETPSSDFGAPPPGAVRKKGQ